VSALSVLLVEDNPRNLKLARDVLEHAGFAVITAMSGEEALPAARAAVPDVILMDLQLPGIDGHAALSQLRADPVTAGIPVVALSAFAMQADRDRAIGSGFDGYLMKPISVREFPGQVRGHARGVWGEP